jgi:hypothetical protein
MGPVAWGRAFSQYLKLLGVKTGRGGDRRGEDFKVQDADTETVASVAKQAGISKTTAYDRMNLASDLEGHPHIAEMVDNDRYSRTTTNVEVVAKEAGPGWAPPPTRRRRKESS